MKTVHGTQDTSRNALIYCRVSSKKQSTQASGLESQEHRCRQFAKEKGYQVDAVFPDDVSGGGDFLKRAGMVALLAYLDAQGGAPYTVIFDDLKRFARDTEFHLRLRRELQLRNARVECLNFRFEDTPEGKFVETVFAAQGQLEREQNARQVRQKMKARVEQGFWVFRAPVGYRYVKSQRGGKELVRDEPLASIVQDALESYASGRFASQAEVRRFLESQPLYPKDTPAGAVRHQTVQRLIAKPVYAGYVHAETLGVGLRQGHHEGLITLETHERILKRMREAAYAPARQDITSDFPLRGAVACGECARQLTAGWCKGKCRKYPYYFCRNRDCAAYGKTIRRERIEGEFRTLLSRLKPTSGLVDAAAAMFRDCWNRQFERAEAAASALRDQARALEDKIAALVDRTVEAGNPRVIAALETRIEALEREKLVLEEKAGRAPGPVQRFEAVFEHTLDFLANPCKLWDSGRLDLQRTVLKLTFCDFLAYDRESGFRTPKTTLPFNILGVNSDHCGEMVLLERFELSASPLPRECSTPELQQHRPGTRREPGHRRTAGPGQGRTGMRRRHDRGGQ